MTTIEVGTRVRVTEVEFEEGLNGGTGTVVLVEGNRKAVQFDDKRGTQRGSTSSHSYLEHLRLPGAEGSLWYVYDESLEVIDDDDSTMTHDEVRKMVREWQAEHDACNVVDQALRAMGIDPNPVPQRVSKATVIEQAQRFGRRNSMTPQVVEGLRKAGLIENVVPGEFEAGDIVQPVGGVFSYRYKVVEIDGVLYYGDADPETKRLTGSALYKITDKTEFEKVETPARVDLAF